MSQRDIVSDALDRRLVAAPMMGRTDAAGCAYLRLVLPKTLLFTEMIPTGALVHDEARAKARLQEYFDWQEVLPSCLASGETDTAPRGNLVLQLGGGEPALLARASAVARAYPFCEINLNLGCPSPRTTKGGFGACLMKSPALAARCVAAVKEGAKGARKGAQGEKRCLPISVKMRIGVDEQDDEESLHAFVDTLYAAGCDVFYIHARKAWLKGVSPKENRTLPPLRPQVVRRLQAARPALPIVYNGGIQSAEEGAAQSAHFAGVMVGRALWRSPCVFAAKEEVESPLWRRQLSEQLLAAIEKALLSPRVSSRSAMRLAMRAMSLYHGLDGARAWRQLLLRAFESVKERE